MLRHMPNALLWIWYWVNPITGILKNLQMMAFAWSIVYMNDQYDDDNGGGDNYPYIDKMHSMTIFFVIDRNQWQFLVSLTMINDKSP